MTGRQLRVASSLRLGYAAVLLLFGLAGGLALLLLFISGSAPDPDLLPRPLVLGALYATPGLIAFIGLRGRRPSLLVAAAIALGVGAFLSFSGLTLIFLLPAILLLGSAVQMRAPHTGRPFALSVGVTLLVAALLIAGGWAVVIGLTAERCASVADFEACSSAAITFEGVLVGAACLGLAIAVAILAAIRLEPGTPTNH